LTTDCKAALSGLRFLNLPPIWERETSIIGSPFSDKIIIALSIISLADVKLMYEAR
tara:strand:+ start:415 stop:582 length:168 start_codon:yes stop_codon:yes gene_type:complete